MNNVWYCVPAKRMEESTLPIWRERGYKIAAFLDEEDSCPIVPDILVRGIYEGYAIAVNKLIKRVLAEDSNCFWFVTGGDDVFPDPTHSPEDIAIECSEFFYNRADPRRTDRIRRSTWGVMQPTGDRNGEQEDWAQRSYPTEPAYIDRICGSPWMGRMFCEMLYGGRGPLWPEFYHMYVDEHLQGVAKKLNILWQRRDLIQKHRCAALRNEPVPEFLKTVYTRKHWDESKEIFMRLKDGGFAEALLGFQS